MFRWIDKISQFFCFSRPLLCHNQNSPFWVKYHFHQFASYLLKMSFTGKEKAFCVLEFDKTPRGHVFNVNFGQNFQSSHQTDVPYRNDMQNLRRRDVCALMCAVQPRACILNICKKFKKTFISLIFAFKFLLRKLKNISFQQKKVWFSYLQQLLRYKLS